MSDIKVENAKRYLKAIKASKQKYLTCELLAKDIGIYSDLIANELSTFDPLIPLDPNYDIRNITQQLSTFVKEHTENRRSPKRTNPKLMQSPYKSVNDFVFSKYVVAGGLMDRSIELTDKDLKDLKKIITIEQKQRKNHR